MFCCERGRASGCEVPGASWWLACLSRMFGVVEPLFLCLDTPVMSGEVSVRVLGPFFTGAVWCSVLSGRRSCLRPALTLLRCVGCRSCLPPPSSPSPRVHDVLEAQRVQVTPSVRFCFCCLCLSRRVQASPHPALWRRCLCFLQELCDCVVWCMLFFSPFLVNFHTWYKFRVQLHALRGDVWFSRRPLLRRVSFPSGGVCSH